MQQSAGVEGGDINLRQAQEFAQSFGVDLHASDMTMRCLILRINRSG